LVYGHNLGAEKHHRVLEYHVGALRHADHDQSSIGPKRKLGWANQVSYILNEDQVKPVQWHSVQGLPDEVRIQVAFFACIDLDGRDSLRGDELRINRCSYVSLNYCDPRFVLQSRNDSLDEGGFP